MRCVAILCLLITTLSGFPGIANADYHDSVDLGRSAEFILDYLLDNLTHDELKFEDYLFTREFDIYGDYLLYCSKEGFYQKYLINDKSGYVYSATVGYNNDSKYDLIDPLILRDAMQCLVNSINRTSEYDSIKQRLGVDYDYHYLIDTHNFAAKNGLQYEFITDDSGKSISVVAIDCDKARQSVKYDINLEDASNVLDAMKEIFPDLQIIDERPISTVPEENIRKIMPGSSVYFHDESTSIVQNCFISAYYSIPSAMTASNKFNELNYFFPNTYGKCYRFENYILLLSADMQRELAQKYVVAFMCSVPLLEE